MQSAVKALQLSRRAVTQHWEIMAEDLMQQGRISQTVLPQSINGFIARCREDEFFTGIIIYHCIIHQQALCEKMVNMKEIMDVAMQINVQFEPDFFNDI